MIMQCRTHYPMLQFSGGACIIYELREGEELKEALELQQSEMVKSDFQWNMHPVVSAEKTKRTNPGAVLCFIWYSQVYAAMVQTELR